MIRATVVLPVPGFPVKTRWCVSSRRGRPAASRALPSWIRLTVFFTCVFTDSSPIMASSSSIGSPSTTPGTGGGFRTSRISAGGRSLCREGGTGAGFRPSPLLSSLISFSILSILRQNSSVGRFNISGGSVGLVTILSTGPDPGRGASKVCGGFSGGRFVGNFGGIEGGRVSALLGRRGGFTLPHRHSQRFHFSG